MPINKKSRAYLITFILLISIFSIITITNPKVKASDTEGKTILYFHNKLIEEKIENEELLYDIILLNEIRMMERLQNEDLENLSEFELLLFFSESLGKSMDQNLPIKTNDSEYPPTMEPKKIIDALMTGNLTIIEELLLSLSPFTGVYVYQGDKTHELKGNVLLSLYFHRPLSYFLNSDTVNVSLSLISTEDFIYKINKTETLETLDVNRELLSGKALKNPALYEISIKVNTTLEPNDILLVDIERDVGDKPLFDDITNEINEVISNLSSKVNLTKTATKLARLGKNLSNTSLPIDFIKNIGEKLLNLSRTINETVEIADEIVNLTEELGIDIYDLVKELISSSLIYDSIEHQSSVTLPIDISKDETSSTKRYYLHENEMDEEYPSKDEVRTIDLSKASGEWTGPELTRNKIVKEATANIYLDYRDLRTIINLVRGKIKLIAEIYDGEELIESSEKELDKTSILGLLENTNEPVQFTFKDLDYEIKHGNSLTLKVFAGNGTDFGLGLYRKVKLLYDSKEYPSSILVKFAETDNIKMKILDDKDRDIVVGGSTEYVLNITSKYADNVELDFTINEENGYWTVVFSNDSVSIPKKGYKLVHIFVNNTDNSPNDYGNYIDLTFIASGKTGIDQGDVKVDISKDAIDYDVQIQVQKKPENIKHGSHGTFEFIIKNNNNGFWPDNYNISIVSEQGFRLDVNYNESKLQNMEAGETAQVNVTVYIPWYTDISSDKLTLTVTSLNDDEISQIKNITISIITPNILEGLYSFFESAAESMGLTEVLGGYAAAFLIFIILFTIFFFIALAIILARRKFIQLICVNRVAKINTDEQAEFEIAVKNPTKHVLTYQASAEIVSPSSDGWEYHLTPQNLVIDPKQAQMLKLIVKPNDYIKNDDWAEIKVTVRTLEKKKTASLSTITTITSEEKPRLKIIGVVQWPRIFKKGDRVVTSFRLENKAKVAANNVSVILYVNGEEKNKVEDIAIPRGGYADIEMPWIAVKGKNEVNIVVI